MQDIDVAQVSEQYFERIRRAALVLTGNPWDADDLAQETFLVFARQVSKFQGKSSVYTYLYGILLNLDRRERRRCGVRRRKLRVVAENEQIRDHVVPAAETKMEVTEWKKSLWAWVDRLPEGQRAALVLRFSEGLQYDEIAQVLDCPLGTVKSRIYHGLMSLRRMMNNEEEEARQLPAYPYEDLTNAI